MRRRRPQTLRGRVVLGAVVALAVGLAVLVVAFNLLLASSLRSDVDTRLRSRAAAALTTVSVKGGRVVTAEGPGDAALDTGVWVYQGTQVIERPRATARLEREVAALVARGQRYAATPDGAYRLHAAPVSAAPSPQGVVVVASSLAAYDRTTDLALIGSFLFALAVLGAVTAVTWVAVGRALHPVEEMTNQAADWGDHDLDRRFGTAARPHELQRLATTFDGLLDRIAASLRHEQRLSAELSHELRTPLARIAAQADLLSRRTHDAAEQRAAAELTLRSTKRMETILDTLMAAARAEAAVAPGVCDADDVARTAVEGAADEAQRRGLLMTVEAPQRVRAGADADVVERVLVPLLENAERFARTAVTVGVHREDSRVIIDVRDDGEGIPADQLDAVFDPGVTFPGGTAGHDGAGLGLPLARRLARTAGGDVRAVSCADGAHLRVILPAC